MIVGIGPMKRQASNIHLYPINLLIAEKFTEELEMMGNGAACMRRSPHSSSMPTLDSLKQ